MSLLKTFLKNARQALSEKNYDYCVSQCEAALEADPTSYNANVFLGLAKSHLNQCDAALTSYRKAIGLDDKNLLAWQGLLNLHEQMSNVQDYVDTASRIAAIHAEAQDNQKCLVVVEKAVSYAKKYGTTASIAQALRLILPVSPFFGLLQDDIPSPADTYVELAQLIENEEASVISAAIAKGRSRLGVKLDRLTRDVKYDTYRNSQLESIYEEIINWSHEEAVRREAESKLLARAVDRLNASPPHEKSGQIARVLNIARGLTIVKAPNRLAWNIIIDWTDYRTNDLDALLLLTFTTLFSDLNLSRALKGFLRSPHSHISPGFFARNEPEERSKGNQPAPEPTLMTPVSIINALSEVYEDPEKDSSLLVMRLLVILYNVEQDYAATIEAAKICLEEIKRIEAMTSLHLTLATAETEIELANAMTYYRSPRFHGQALDLYTQAMKCDNAQLQHLARLGIARIHRLSGHYQQAYEFLANVPRDAVTDTAAVLELSLCDIAVSHYEQALKLLLMLNDHLADSGDRSTLAEVQCLLGDCRMILADDQNSEADAFACYIQSLRYNPNHAPTYTALGLYYADVVKDQLRAEKCFQKALELSSREIRAAERLASAFADSGDWELVQIIAQRIIQGNESLKVAWPYRAIGFVYLNTGKFQLAVTSFQNGLRLAIRDVDAWVGLGESYLELGRFSAAEKAFARASVLDEDNWYAKFLGSTVATALGEHDIACHTLERLVASEDTVGLQTSLMTAYLAWAKSLLAANWYSKASTILTKCLHAAITVVKADNNSMAYEALAQAAMLLAQHGYNNDKQMVDILRDMECLPDISKPSSNFLPEAVPSLSTRSRLALTAARTYLTRIGDTNLSGTDEALLWFSLHSCIKFIVTFDKVDDEWQEASITAVRCAIKLDPASDVFWSALGITVGTQDTPLAQHCLIRAITLDDKSALHWANLGYLYLKTYQMEASHLAFMKAQTLDPTAALVWLGQAWIARQTGEPDHDLYEHALRLGSAAKTPILAVEFVRSVLRDGARGSSNFGDVVSLAIWSLDQASKGPNRDAVSNVIPYLRALLSEYTPGPIDEEDDTTMRDITSLSEKLEAAFEEDESDDTLRQYCDVKALLARLQLRHERDDAALETAASVLGLEPSDNPQSLKSCKLVTAVAQHYSGDEDDSLATIQELCEEFPEDPESFQYLVQILAANKDEDSRKIVSDLIQRDEKFRTVESKLLRASIIASFDKPTDEQRAIARTALCDVALEKDHQVKRLKNAIESTMEQEPAIWFSQVHYDPSVAGGWLNIVKTTDDAKTRENFMKMASRAADQTLDVDDLARVYRACSDVPSRSVALHLAPHCL